MYRCLHMTGYLDESSPQLHPIPLHSFQTNLCPSQANVHSCSDLWLVPKCWYIALSGQKVNYLYTTVLWCNRTNPCVICLSVVWWMVMVYRCVNILCALITHNAARHDGHLGLDCKAESSLLDHWGFYYWLPVIIMSWVVSRVLMSGSLVSTYSIPWYIWPVYCQWTFDASLVYLNTIELWCTDI